MKRPGTHVGKAHGIKQLGNRTLIVGHAITIFDNLLQVDTAPAYNAIRIRIGAGFNQFGKFAQLGFSQPSLTLRTLAVDQAFRPCLRATVKSGVRTILMRRPDQCLMS